MVKENCFAHIKNKEGKERCFCLNEMICKKGECSFYKTRSKAKKDYLDRFNGETQAKIDRGIDKYFRNL